MTDWALLLNPNGTAGLIEADAIRALMAYIERRDGLAPEHIDAPASLPSHHISPAAAAGAASPRERRVAWYHPGR